MWVSNLVGRSALAGRLRCTSEWQRDTEVASHHIQNLPSHIHVGVSLDQLEAGLRSHRGKLSLSCLSEPSRALISSIYSASMGAASSEVILQWRKYLRGISFTFEPVPEHDLIWKVEAKRVEWHATGKAVLRPPVSRLLWIMDVQRRDEH